MHVVFLCEVATSFCTENYEYSCFMFSTCVTASFTVVSYFFFLYWLLSSSLCTNFDVVIFKMDEVLSINPSANYSSLETLTSVIRTSWTILVELIDLVDSVIIFLFLTALFSWFTFLLGSLTSALTVVPFWIYVFLLTLVFVLL